jgi:deferrochelatase/peroxidase EfeB
VGGGALAAAGATAGIGYAAGSDTSGDGSGPPGPSAADGTSATVPFEGAHQAGIATPAQARLVFGAFDLSSDRKEDLQQLLQLWTAAARLMTQGKPTGAGAAEPDIPPADTGEAEGLGPSRLTITVGLAPEVFERDGKDRMGLAGRRPSALLPLGDLPGDQLDPARTGGDLCVQACADDPQVAFHAVRNLLRVGRGLVTLRWMQLGFGSNTATTSTQQTPRNLMGFKDGTRNIKVDDPKLMNDYVWVGGDEPQTWFHGGSYLVARRIRMLIESWDRDALGDQQTVFGRQKASGAPLTGTTEHQDPDFAAKLPDGSPVIATDAHIRLAAPEQHEGMHILRRGYAYTDGIDARTGFLDAGLFFVAFQRDPAKQFVTLQKKLGASDLLNEYIQHTGSGVFAVLPGVGARGYLGQGLFA